MTDLKENGFSSNRNFFGYSGNNRDDILPVPSTSEESRFMKMEENNSRKTGGSVAALKELVSCFLNYQLLDNYYALLTKVCFGTFSVRLKGII